MYTPGYFKAVNRVILIACGSQLGSIPGAIEPRSYCCNVGCWLPQNVFSSIECDKQDSYIPWTAPGCYFSSL